MDASRIRYLLRQQEGKTLRADERSELNEYLSSPESKELLSALIAELYEDQGTEMVMREEIAKNILQLILETKKETARIVKMHRQRGWYKFAGAAVLFVAMAVGAYLMFSRNAGKNLANLPQEQRFKNDISPARQQVVLTLPDGSAKNLDSIANGPITLPGTTKAIKKEGSIVYLTTHKPEVVFNTVTTGKGRTFHLQLADGTNVWLDALSSVHFPTSFPGADRAVEVSGQAYFEVAKNPNQPFKVKNGNEIIEVLGTHFNINSYNSLDLQTTLLEGSVKVFSNSTAQSIVITPGQQAKVDNNGAIKLADNVDLDEVMAWKNGRFQFNGSSVDEIMNQLSRWYDINVVYKDRITETFVADINRDMPVSKLLALLEMTKQIRFVIEGHKVTVMK